MSTPTGDNAFLHELELDIRTDLTIAETSQPAEQAGEWVPDTEAERYEIRLRNMLGAVEALEEGSGPGGQVPQAQ